MGMEPVIFVSNPGSSSRKYALYKGNRQRAKITYEYDNGKLVYRFFSNTKVFDSEAKNINIDHCFEHAVSILLSNKIIKSADEIDAIGLRIVAPSQNFLDTRLINEEAHSELINLKKRTPIHLGAILKEINSIRENTKDIKIYGVSDSAFHKTKPDYAWNYGIDIELADRLNLKRYGYHGLSAKSVVRSLKYDLPSRLVICHLGSGASVSAVLDGLSLDNTMGFSPLEGLIMSTRSGTIDISVANIIKESLSFNDDELEKYLNKESGLLGLSKQSADMKTLISSMESGDHYAKLAINTYVYNVTKAIGQMVAVLGGVDSLVFTGTIGSRSATIRSLVVEKLEYFGLKLDIDKNSKCYEPAEPSTISARTRVSSVIVLTVNEELEIAKSTLSALKN